MKKHKNHNSKHHIRPVSREPQLKHRDDNISIISEEKHRDYHKLFGNRMPEEVVRYLNNYFWNGRFKVQISERR